MKEEWKPIKGYEGLYEVSNLGRVRTLEHMEKFGNKKRVRKGRIKSTCMRNNYVCVQLSKNGINKSINMHRLVAMMFIPNPDNLPQVNHKDQDTTNNCIDNLEWCTTKYNIHYADADKKRRASMDWYYKSKACKEKMRIVGSIDWRKVDGNHSDRYKREAESDSTDTKDVRPIQG